MQAEGLSWPCLRRAYRNREYATAIKAVIKRAGVNPKFKSVREPRIKISLMRLRVRGPPIFLIQRRNQSIEKIGIVSSLLLLMKILRE